ncbi:MAG: metal-dependent hydrolase [Spirochaetales bacterium]|nr:metal-dependent hydrolase [Spirochaetales bacterium]
MSVKIDQIIRSDRRTLEVEISVEGHIIIRSPLDQSMESIQEYIDSKKFYLLRTQQIAKARYLNDLHKKYEDGEKFLYLGKERPLKISTDDPVPFDYREGVFYLSSSYLKFANKFFVDWYKKMAKEYISEIANRYSQLYNVDYEKIVITNAHSQWGSCTGNGTLNFTWRVILVPHEVITYLVVHELAHIEIREHSNRYWLEVEKMMPDYLKYENWVNDNGHICAMFKDGTFAKTPSSNSSKIKKKNIQLELDL